MACSNSGTLRNTPRRIACSVNSRNHRSTRFNQLELVGMKWRQTEDASPTKIARLGPCGHRNYPSPYAASIRLDIRRPGAAETLTILDGGGGSGIGRLLCPSAHPTPQVKSSSRCV